VIARTRNRRLARSIAGERPDDTSEHKWGNCYVAPSSAVRPYPKHRGFCPSINLVKAVRDKPDANAELSFPSPSDPPAKEALADPGRVLLMDNCPSQVREKTPESPLV
jgi:hypothetical protein